MDIFDEKIDELLAKHLAGECSPEEEEAFGRWLSESPDHREYFEGLQWLWEHSPEGLTPPTRTVDTDAALQRVKDRLKKGGGPAPALYWQRGFLMRAAAVIVLAIAAVYWWQSSNKPDQTLIAATQSALTDTLTDGTVISLERGSGLTLTPAFNRRERRVRLEGEGYFQVAHDTVRPFVVEVQELEVTVVGTAFYVDNTTDPGKVTVFVTEGKVRVVHQGNTLLLTPGEFAVFDRQTGALTRGVAAPEQGSPVQKFRIFRFDATPLETVIRQLNTSYGVNISLKNQSLEKCLLTARYNGLSLDRVLELVAESFSIRVEKTADGYVLDGEGCGE